MTTLQTERLTLRPARESDLEAMHAVLSDPRATAYWATPPHETLDVTRDWLASMIAIPPGEGEDFIVEWNGRAIGKAGFHRFPTIGFIFLPEVWGRGFAKEALIAVIARVFEAHRLPRLLADVDPHNEASLGLLEGLGFERTGYREKSWLIGDKWYDSVDLALDAGKWSANG